jgi:hypothetical protein
VKDVLNNFFEESILVQLNIIELLTEVARSAHASQLLLQTNFIPKVLQIAKDVNNNRF